MKKANILLAAGLLLGLVCVGRLAAQPDRANTGRGRRLTDQSNVPGHFWISKRLTIPVQLYEMSNRSLALDAAGHPHIAYGDRALYYSWHDGIEWHQEIVDDISPNAGSFASLALDGNGIPHLAYSQWNATGEMALLYATHTSTGWVHLLLDQREMTSISIAVDSFGNPHIAYTADDNGGIRYMYRTGEHWLRESINAGVWPLAVSLALDENDTPHLSYTVAFSEGGTRYATKLGDQWQIEAVESQAFGATSLALDNQGRPAIAFQSWLGMRFASRTSQGWTIEQINNDAYTKWLSLAIDANNVPHISYYDSFLDAQMYATRPAATWLITPVDTNRDSGHYNSLALDQQGQPHISYAYTADSPSPNPYFGALKYARLSGGSWLTETAAAVGYHVLPKLAIGSDDRVRLIYYSIGDNQWYYLYQTKGGWSTEIIDTPATTDYALVSFLLDSDNNPRFIYYDLNDDLRYVYRANDQWYNQLITADVTTNGRQAASLALDQNGQPHVVFNHNATDILYYTYLDGIFWIGEAVEVTTGYDIESISLRFDALDRSHLAYGRYANGLLEVRYGQRPADQWLLETIADGVYPDLALDSQDNPHLIYYHWEKENAGLYYLYWTGTNWVTQTIKQPVSAWNTSLTLDANDHPHVTYLTSYSVNYAYHDGAAWLVYDAAYGNYDNFTYPTLALTSQNRPLILSTDADNGHLLLSQFAASLAYSPLIFRP
jgi:hypothetical protein